MGVPGRGDAVRARRGREGRYVRKYVRQRGPGGGRRTGDVVQVEGVEHVLQGAQDLVPPRPVHRQLARQFRKHLDVQHQVPQGFVEYGEVGRTESVDGPIPGGQDVSRVPR